MHSVLIITHISFMVVSLILMPTAIILALRGVRASVRVATGGMATTAVGFIMGLILVLDNPLSLRCALLTGYLFAMIALYAFGFGWGYTQNARLLRVSAAVQKS